MEEKQQNSSSQKQKIIESEFRVYNKLNCNLFNLIGGDLEPKQTKALGYLLSASPLALKTFLDLVGYKNSGKTIDFNHYIVNCEVQKKQNKCNDRIDILLRFYHDIKPVRAIIIEAKSVRSKTSQINADKQACRYTDFPILEEFKDKVTTVTLTRDVIRYEGNSTPLSWSDLIDGLYSCYLKFQKKPEVRTIENFVCFILNIEGSMKYFDEEILSVPVGKTWKAVKETGIYECPSNYREHKNVLYMAFRGKNGVMDTLYKVSGVYELCLYDESSIDDINTKNPGFKERIEAYKNLVEWKEDRKRLYLLDMENALEMPYKVRPAENNSFSIYYSMSDFLAQPNLIADDKSCNEAKRTIIVAKNITIENNRLSVKQGCKLYELQTKDGQVLSSMEQSYDLDPSKEYVLMVHPTKKATNLKCINLQFDEKKSKWLLLFDFHKSV